MQAERKVCVMDLTEYRAFIKNMYLIKGHGLRRLIMKFGGKDGKGPDSKSS